MRITIITANQKGNFISILAIILVFGFFAVSLGMYKNETDYSPFEIMAEIESIAQQSLWPGFNPLNFPIAFYDGEKTFLFNHPNPPEEFVAVEGHDTVYVFEGQHEKIRANTVMKINEVQTATILLETMEDLKMRDCAAVAIHEIFHVFQLKKHPDWWKLNELEFFIYPFEDVEILSLRKLETDAIRKALRTEEPYESARWCKTALLTRRERFEKMKKGAINYERGIELLEGTAHYLQYQVAGKHLHTEIKVPGYLPEQVRLRGYAIGNALCLLLDRFQSDWKERLEKEEHMIIDDLLETAISRIKAETFQFTKEQKEEALRTVEKEIKTLLSQRRELKAEFFSQTGWQITVLSENEPLWPKGFDPLNIKILNNLELLHMRWLKLGNSFGSIEVLNRKSLTSPKGEHSLFQGIKKITVTGISEEPIVEKAEGKVSINIDGLNLKFEGAEIEREGKSLLIKLPKPN